MEIRPLDAGDADAAAAIAGPLQPGIVVTSAYFTHRERSEPPRTRRCSWLALESGEPVGFGTCAMKWDEPNGIARFWIGVRPDRRSRGTGAALYEQVERHAHAIGAPRLTVEVDDDSAGLRFVQARGFERLSAEIVSSLDPGEVDLSELDGLLAETSASGFELSTLRAFAGRPDDLAAFYEAAGAWPPAGDDANRITPQELWRYIFERPELTWDGSFLVVDDTGRLVSFAALVVDAAARRAENEWTATLPVLRGRRLALLGKLATIRWAREAGIRQIVTANDDDNAPMLALNQRLGYRRLYEQIEFGRDL